MKDDWKEGRKGENTDKKEKNEGMKEIKSERKIKQKNIR